MYVRVRVCACVFVHVARHRCHLMEMWLLQMPLSRWCCHYCLLELLYLETDKGGACSFVMAVRSINFNFLSCLSMFLAGIDLGEWRGLGMTLKKPTT